MNTVHADSFHKEFEALEKEAFAAGWKALHTLQEALRSAGITLGSPVTFRTKTWESVKAKLEARTLKINELAQMDDLLGLRVVCLFRADVQAACQIVETAFRVLRRVEVERRLGRAEFGYGSVHYVISIPDEWFTPASEPVASHSRLIRGEIQVRSLAQHLWAEAAHGLTYKQAYSVTRELERSVARLAALIELLDLELDRISSAARGRSDEHDGGT